jgi:trimeric autotransporter adhesin
MQTRSESSKPDRTVDEQPAVTLTEGFRRRRIWALCCAAAWTFSIGSAGAIVPKKASSPLDRKAFFVPELYISTSNIPLAEVIDELPNRSAWQALAARSAPDGAPVLAFIDPRSGVASNLVQSVPLIPGGGQGNRVSLQSLGQRLGRPVKALDASVVAAATLAHVRAQAALLGIDTTQLGDVRATQVTADLWQISIPQQYRGIPVRHGRLIASISHGNLVVMGAAAWGNVALADTTPAISAEEALAKGFAYAEGRTAEDRVLSEPALEIVPFAPSEHQTGPRFTGRVGEGYGHRLVWSFVFRRLPELAQWEVLVDAQSGDVITFRDLVHYAKRQIAGGVYPLSNTEVCPDNRTCGVMQGGWPMPFADTGLPAPHDFANSAGVFEYTSGTATTTLTGRYLRVRQGGVSPLNESSATGSIALGGANGQHDFTAPDGSEDGNNAPARTAYYELNKMMEIGRGYLPNNPWLYGVLRHPLPFPLITAHVNVGGACNAFYMPDSGGIWGEDGSVNFLRSGEDRLNPGYFCRNTGEIAGVLDHEWGHGLDEHDGSRFSSPSEAYADIAAMYRTQASCQGHGFFESNPEGCGLTADGKGFNRQEAQTGSASYCTTNCSGVREADWAKHAPATPATALGFVCNSCFESPGPCGKEVHCAAAPVTQAAWDLVTRDLTSPPFNLDSQSAFIVGNKLFYHGSGNVGAWYSCTCGQFSSGCAAENGYMQWITADDDDGNLLNGTPHMTAIYNAFARHGIGCAPVAQQGRESLASSDPTPEPRNSGCAAGPSAAPSLSVTPGHYRASLSWNAVPGATRYWVFRTEGHAGCAYGKALIAETTGLTFTDLEVAGLRPYHYNVVAAGTSSACYSRASNCATVTPNAGSYTVSCTPSSLSVAQGGTVTAACSVTPTGGYDSAVTLGCSTLPAGALCRFTPATVTLSGSGSQSSTLTLSTGLAAAGTYTFKVMGTPSARPPATNSATLGLTVLGPGDQMAAFDPTLRAPSCGSTVGSSCDTGSLVNGRGTSESGNPNTINRSCLDGTASGTGAINRIRVSTASGGNFTAGAEVNIAATIPATIHIDDAVDFFYAEDASNPAWVYIGTRTPGTTTTTVGGTYRLPASGLQAVRVQYRRGGSAAACAPGLLNDPDDLVFAAQ